MTIKAGDLIAGPILRRVEPTLVTVWCALRVPAMVTLRVYKGRGPGRTLREAKPTSGSRTVRVGHELHVVVASFEPTASLVPGETYGYDLAFVGAAGGESNFTNLKLLQTGTLDANGDIQSPAGPTGHLSLPLGYTDGNLPSFSLPPAAVTDLKVVHGSCRRPFAEGRDAMVGLDSLIEAQIASPTGRPHMLVLTGDQIYADEVEPTMLRALSRIGAELLAGRPTGTAAQVVSERLPVDLPALDSLPAETALFPVDQSHLPAGRRQRLVVRAGKLSTGSGESHLLGLGEFAAMYCMVWSNVLWPDLKPSLVERGQDVLGYRLAHGSQRQSYHAIVASQGMNKATDEAARNVGERQPYHQAWRLVPRPLRLIDSFLTESDRAVEWNDPHEDWKHFWDEDNARLPPHPDDALTPAETAAFGSPNAAAAVKLRRLGRLLTPVWYAGVESFKAEVVERLDDGIYNYDVVQDSERIRLHRLRDFYKGLAYVRRALANVPTYMMCDDHEITDDWNISKKWVDEVNASSLGRAVLRNGLAAFALFQAWGNDPRRFGDASTPQGELLADLGLLFNETAGGAKLATGPKPDVATRVERRLQLLPRDSFIPVTWHFQLTGPSFELLGLDGRTRRGFSPDNSPLAPMTNEAPAGLLSDEALADQISASAAAGMNPDGVCFVLAPAPFLGAVLLEQYGQPIYNVIDEYRTIPSREHFYHQAEADFMSGRLNHDPEPWGFVPRLFEAVLAKLSSRRRVVFLSGDVHYGVSIDMTYWRMPVAAERTTRFVQLTSSAFQNRQPVGTLHTMNMALIQQLGGTLTDSLERVAWTATSPGDQAPIASPAGTPFNSRTQALLAMAPIVISPRAMPAGTTQRRAPEWAWRMRSLVDPRPDNQRSDDVQAPALPSTAAPDKLPQIAARHAWQTLSGTPRRILWDSNICQVSFDGNDVVHRLYAVKPHSTRWLTHVLRVEHRASLAFPSGEAAPAVPTQAPPPSGSSGTGSGTGSGSGGSGSGTGGTGGTGGTSPSKPGDQTPPIFIPTPEEM